MSRPLTALSSAQEVALVVLRTLVGWHFLYEGYFKLLRGAWSRGGDPLSRWSSAGYLKGASGPFASVFQGFADSPWIGGIDTAVAVGLVLIGLSLVLGLFTQAGCVGALLLLALFYLSAIPLRGVPEPHTEGTYLLVNKNLVEAAGVLVVFLFRTGRIAGLDRLRAQPRAETNPVEEAA